MRYRRFASTIATALIVGLAAVAPSVAEDGRTDSLSGELRTGFRLVSVGGVEDKYDQHVNLESGPRLFGLNLDYRPGDGELGSFADLVTIRANNLGGDPFESSYFGIQKFGSYSFSYERRESTYIYQNVLYPDGFDLTGLVELAATGELHSWNLDREADIANLRIHLSDRANLNFGFNRYAREGDSETTFDIDRAEYVLARPIEDSLEEYVLGFDYSWDKVTLFIEERVRDYEGGEFVFAPGRTLALNDPDDPMGNLGALDRFEHEQNFEYASLQHSVRVNARPSDRLTLSGAVIFNDLDYDIDYSQDGTGLDRNGNPNTDLRRGEGEIERQVLLIDFDGSYAVSDAVAILFGVRQHDFDQEGEHDAVGFDDGVQDDDLTGIAVGNWNYTTTGYEAGIGWQVSPEVSLTGGIRYEERDIDEVVVTDFEEETSVEEEPDTDQTGYFINVGWAPNSRFRLTGDVETSDYDDPYTISSPTDRMRYRATARYTAPSGFWVSGSGLVHDAENDIVDYQTDYQQFRVDAGYMTDRLSVSGGYALVNIEQEGDQATFNTGGAFLRIVPIRYDTDTDQVTGSLRWRFADDWALGGQANYYTADGTWEQDWLDARCFIEYDITSRYLARIGYRMIDYEEPLRGFNDYDADIVDLQVGVRF